MDPYIIAYLLGRPTMSFALHPTGRENNLRHIKAKSFIIISINSIHAVTYVLHCILLATGQKKTLLNQQHWKTSLQLYKLCHIIWSLGIFNQMKTAGCLGCYSTASPRSSITTRMGESGGSGTGKLQTRLFGGMFGI